MDSRYWSSYVVCPFYRYNEQKRIVCEGIGKGNTLHLVFASQPMMHDHAVRFCNDIDNYSRCLICQMLERKEEYQ